MMLGGCVLVRSDSSRVCVRCVSRCVARCWQYLVGERDVSKSMCVDAFSRSFVFL